MQVLSKARTNLPAEVGIILFLFFKSKVLGGPDDYEVFNPIDPIGGDCTLGRNTTYIRKKAASICIPDPNEMTSTTNICEQCTLSDYMWFTYLFNLTSQ